MTTTTSSPMSIDETRIYFETPAFLAQVDAR